MWYNCTLYDDLLLLNIQNTFEESKKYLFLKTATILNLALL